MPICSKSMGLAKIAVISGRFLNLMVAVAGVRCEASTFSSLYHNVKNLWYVSTDVRT